MNRGDVVLVDWPYSDGTGKKLRPAIVIHADYLNGIIDDMVLLQITIKAHGIPGTEVQIDPRIETASCLPHISYAFCPNLLTIEEELIDQVIGRLSPGIMSRLDVCIKSTRPTLMLASAGRIRLQSQSHSLPVQEAVMTARQFLFSLLAASLICSLSPAAPPDGKEPAKDGKAASKPVLAPVWKFATQDRPPHEVVNPNECRHGVQWLTKTYAATIKSGRELARPIASPAVPSVVNSLLVYTNDFSVTAFGVGDDRRADPPVEKGELFWAALFAEGLVNQANNVAPQTLLDTWLNRCTAAERVDLLTHRTLSCSFEANDRYVCYVEELGVLPPASYFSQKLSRGSDFGALREPMEGNILWVRDLATGKLTLHIGNNSDRIEQNKPFGGNHYLGPPLPRGDDLFVIHEKDRKLRLTKLNPSQVTKAWRGGAPGIHVEAANATFLWDSVTVSAPTGILRDPHRRIHAIHLVQSGDLILCPTHLGRVVAVESKTGKIKWTHEYAPLDAKRFPTFAPEWVVVPPVVVGDKYIYAPADFTELLCLNIADGKKVWSVKKGDGLYPAVVGEQVLVIGEKTLRSLDLKDGREKWKLDLPGLPCGRGAILGDHYLVPVSEPKTWRGMIAMVDVKNGKITELIKPDKDEPVGNLVVHQEFLISQTLTEIVVFPIKR